MNVAVVTGAGGAIGSAIADRLSSQQLHVLCVDLDDRAEMVAARIRAKGGDATAATCDLADQRAPAMILAASQGIGEISVLVNNAGITRDGRALDIAPADFTAVISLNLVAPMRLIAALAPRMAAGGAIVNIASRAALGNFGQANYVTAKSGLVGATRAHALAHAPRLRVNAVAPGLVDTPMTQAMPAHVLDKLIGRVPLGRQGAPQEIAEAVAFLSSDRSSYVTGQTMVVCGGRSVGG